MLGKLADYPVDNTGIMIGKDVPFSKPHRHYSHLFAIFPLYVLNVEDQPERRPLMELSISHFLGLEGDNCMFKFTGASSLYSSLGNGDEALRCLQRAVAPQLKGPTVTANTLYSENGWQTFESPESAARDILDMLLQSWGDTIRVFPACPSAWKDVSFYHLRAQGAFLVSASRRNGRTRFVAIKSLAGEPCRLRCDLPRPVHMIGSNEVTLHQTNDVLDLTLPKDGEAILYSGDTPPDANIAPEEHRDAPNPWGLPAAER